MAKKPLLNTIKFRKQVEPPQTPHEILEAVYKAMVEKNYDPVDQFVGYFLTEDPTYITSHNNARTIITKAERYELFEELVRCYIENNLTKQPEENDKT